MYKLVKNNSCPASRMTPFSSRSVVLINAWATNYLLNLEINVSLMYSIWLMYLQLISFFFIEKQNF